MSDTVMDLDSLVEEAWRGFREAFAGALEALDGDAMVEVALDVGERLDGAAPYVRAGRDGDELVLEVSSNRVLAGQQRLTRRGQRHLRQLGFALPSTGRRGYRTSVPVSRVDQAASVAVSALRLAFGAVHPAFLVSDDLVWKRGGQPAGTEAAVATAVYPVDQEHLDRLIDQALSPMLGRAPYRDGDGDIPIRAGAAVIFVRGHVSTGSILLFADMVVDVDDRDRAVHQVDALNREVEGVKFTLHDDTVVASADLLAAPFVPEHLQLLVSHMCEVVSGRDAALASSVGGRVLLAAGDSTGDSTGDDIEEGDDEEDGIHPVMLCILQLDADRPGSVGPATAAKLCGYDSDLLLELIRWNEREEIAWRQARDEAYAVHEDDEAGVCEIERAHASRTVAVLRKALRRVLLG